MADTSTAIEHEDSIDSQDPKKHPDKKTKSRRPASMSAHRFRRRGENR